MTALALRSCSLVFAVLALGCGAGSGPDSADSATDAAGEDASGGSDGATGDGGPTDGGDASGDDSAGESGGDDGPPAGPHALGRIAIGEVHSAHGGASTPMVTATFVPNTEAAPATCAVDVGSCRVLQVPECEAGCDSDEYCAFDAACVSTCLPICDAPCDDGEVCYFPTPGTAACKTIESFDAGALEFSGTTVPLTLFPPYAFAGEQGGALFLSGADLSLRASGASGAGFSAFERSFTATSLLLGRLDEIDTADAYGEGPMPVSWTPGVDDVTVEVSVAGLGGSFGTVVCEADDAAGTTVVPREAMRAALDPDDVLSAVTVTLRRTKSETHHDLTTTGSLSDTTVEPVGWLELSTFSAEQVSVEGCGFGELVCGSDCVDVLSSNIHCGGCDQPCAGTCLDGQCGAAADSCVGICGQQAPSGCWCNPLCVEFGDCCDDYEIAC